jgi:hypothetical protein
MNIPNYVIAIAFIFEAFFWLSVYALIIRTGFKQKIHAMPVIAMAGNISWELMLGMGMLGGPFSSLKEQFPACPASWPSCPENLIGFLTLSAALMDVVIAYIIIRWGVKQINTDWLAKHFKWFVLAGIGTAFTILIFSVSDFYIVNPYDVCEAGQNVGCMEDSAPAFLSLSQDGGFTTGAVLAVIMNMLFISWIINRDDLRGQSFFIALFMALGNTSAYVVAMLWSGFQLAPITHVLSVVSLTLNFTYVYLYVRRAKELNINPYALRWSS